MKTILNIPMSLLLLTSCQTTRWNALPDVNDSLLAYVPEDRMGDVDQAKRRQNEIAQQLAVATRDCQETDAQEELARANLDIMNDRLDKARKAASYAKRYETTDEFEAKRRHREDLEAAVRLAKAKVVFYDDLRDLAERRVDLLEQRSNLAAARLELAKAKAVTALDRPVAKDIEVDDYRQVAGDLAEAAFRARIETRVARERVRLDREHADELAADVPEALRTDPLQSVDDSFSLSLPTMGEEGPPPSVDRSGTSQEGGKGESNPGEAPMFQAY